MDLLRKANVEAEAWVNCRHPSAPGMCARAAEGNWEALVPSEYKHWGAAGVGGAFRAHHCFQDDWPRALGNTRGSSPCLCSPVAGAFATPLGLLPLVRSRAFPRPTLFQCLQFTFPSVFLPTVQLRSAEPSMLAMAAGFLDENIEVLG